MTTYVAFAFVLLAFCTPAFADSAPPARPAVTKIRFSLQEASTTRSFNVILSADSPCATASQKAGDRELELKACTVRDSLAIEWHLRTAAGEYRSSSSIPLEHGSTAELGSTPGPHLTVTIE